MMTLFFSNSKGQDCPTIFDPQFISASSDAVCAPIRYSFGLFSEDDVENVQVEFDVETQVFPPGVTKLVPYDIPGFTFNDGIASGTFNVIGGQINYFELTFYASEAWVFDEGPIAPIITISTNNCPDQTFTYPNFIPKELEIFIAEGETVLMSEAAICPTFPCNDNTFPVAPGFTGPLAGSHIVNRGTLIFDITEPYFLENMVIYMGENAQIILRPNSNVFISQGTEITGCAEMWNTIRVEGRATLTVSNGATIKDGIQAIQALDGSEINITNTSFLNNRIGINIPSAGSESGEIEHEIDNNSFSVENSFFNEGLLPPFEGQLGEAGIKSVNLEQLNLFRNHFNNLYNGILLNTTNAIVLGGSYIDMLESSNVSASGFGIRALGNGHVLLQNGLGNDINNPTFDNCRTGVFAFRYNTLVGQNGMKNMGTGTSILFARNLITLIEDNTIEAEEDGARMRFNLPVLAGIVRDNDITINGNPHTSTGIRALENPGGGASWRIRDNIINIEEGRFGVQIESGDNVTMERNDISLNTLAEQDGICLDGTDNITVFCNTVQGSTTDFDSGTIGLFGFSVPNSKINCNTFNKTRLGVQMLDMNDQTLFQGNSFNDHYYGFQMGIDIGPGINQIASISPHNHRGNVWDNSSMTTKAVHFGEEGDIILSQFRVDVSENPDYFTLNETPNSPLTTWFLTPASNGTFTCPSGNICPPVEIDEEEFIPDELDEAIRDGQIGGEDIDLEGLVWEAEQRLAERIKETEGLAANYYAFLIETMTYYLGQYIGIRVDIENSIAYKVAQQVIAKAEAENIQEHRQAIAAIVYDILNNNEDFTDQIDLQNHIEAVISSHDVIYNLYQVHRVDLDALLPDIQVNLDAIVPQADYEIMETQVNNIYLASFQSDTPDFLTDEQQSILAYIANQCPFTARNAVFKARALLGISEAINLENCTVNTQGFKAVEQPTEFLVFPNPAKEFITIQFNKEIEEGNLVITDLLGRKVSEVKVINASEQPIITTSLKTGFYYLTLYEDDQLIQTQKVSIIH